jgi:hypothetical protein
MSASRTNSASAQERTAMPRCHALSVASHSHDTGQRARTRASWRAREMERAGERERIGKKMKIKHAILTLNSTVRNQGSTIRVHLLSSVKPDGVRSRRSRTWRTSGCFRRYTHCVTASILKMQKNQKKNVHTNILC